MRCALAAGELVRIAAHQAGIEADAAQHARDVVVDARRASTRPCTIGASPTMSVTRMRGLSDGIRVLEDHLDARASRRARCGAVQRLRRPGPASRTLPSVGGMMPATMRPSVDLPQPDSPTRPTTSPRATVRSTSSTACTTSSRSPAPSRLASVPARSTRLRTKRFETPRSSMMRRARHARDALRSRQRMEAADDAARRLGHRRPAPARQAASARGQRGAEGAARRQVEQRRRHAGDLRAAARRAGCGWAREPISPCV